MVFTDRASEKVRTANWVWVLALHMAASEPVVHDHPPPAQGGLILPAIEFESTGVMHACLCNLGVSEFRL